MNAETNPPIRQSAKTAKSARSEWRTVICTDHFRKAIFTENTLKPHFDQLITHATQVAAAKKITAGMITYRQWIAATAIVCFEVALEIRTPYLVTVTATGQWQLSWSGFAMAFTRMGQTLLT